MRESEAKTKWCPMVRVLIGPENSAWQSRMITNRADIPAGPQDCLCIGSACMMWEPSKTFNGGGDCGLKRIQT